MSGQGVSWHSLGGLLLQPLNVELGSEQESGGSCSGSGRASPPSCGTQLPSPASGKFCASEFISFPCTGSRWHGAPCPLVVNTAGRLLALEVLWLGIQCCSAAVLGLLLLVLFTSLASLGAAALTPRLDCSEQLGSWHPEPTSGTDRGLVL